MLQNIGEKMAQSQGFLFLFWNHSVCNESIFCFTQLSLPIGCPRYLMKRISLIFVAKSNP